ncbi:MAG TPA: response regulator [Sphingomonas sp.]|nr:response regulator [Sphingomonas sp.]
MVSSRPLRNRVSDPKTPEAKPLVVADGARRHVYVVDDDAAVRRSTSILLTAAGYMPRPFVSGTDFLEEAAELRPGVVLLDIRMPELDGLSLLDRLPEPVRARLPVVMITGHGDLPTAVKAMKIGAKDFLEKPFDDTALFNILDSAFAGLQACIAEQSRRSERRALMDKLTPRELDVLCALAQGHANKMVAHELGLSVRTVEMHRAKLLDRLGVRTVAEAVRIAYEAKLEL